MKMLLWVRWRDPKDPRKNAYRGACLILDGWEQFRIDFVNDMNAIRGAAPALVGTINFDRSARLCWDLLKEKLRVWSIREFGRVKKPRQIVKYFEKHFVEKEKPPPIEKSEFEMTQTGYQAGMIDDFRSSGMTRKGTLHEIASDIADDGKRERTHRLIDDAIEDEKRGATDG